MMRVEATPVPVVLSVVIPGSVPIGLLIVVIPLRSDLIASLDLFLLFISFFGSLIRIRGLSLLSALFFVLLSMLFLLFFLILLFLPLLTTFLLLLAARILLHCVPVQLEQLPG